MKINLGVLYGGKSPEHNVSLATAMAVMNAVDKNKFNVTPIYITKEGKWMKGEQFEGSIENIKQLQSATEEINVMSLQKETNATLQNMEATTVIFPLLHGPNGEDGTVQGLLELLDIPYVGNGVLGSAVGMDKVIMKHLFAQAKLNQVDYVSFTRTDWQENAKDAYREVEEVIGYPCFVKPVNAGSSIGISKCQNKHELQAAFSEAFKYDRKIIVEQGVVAREIEVGVIGNDRPSCSVAGEIVPKKEFYDYQAKYEDGNTDLMIPANITEEEYEMLKELAIKAYKALDLSGLARVDFFLTKEGVSYINEVNTLPGFTPFSMFPLLFKNTGVPYDELIEQLVKLAIEKYKEKQKITYTFE